MFRVWNYYFILNQKKDKLNARLIEIQERFAKVLDKCGPGANKDITKDESKSELTGFQRTNDLFQPSFGPGGLGRKLTNQNQVQ